MQRFGRRRRMRAGRAPERRDDFWEKFCGVTHTLFPGTFIARLLAVAAAAAAAPPSLSFWRQEEGRERTEREERERERDYGREGTGTIPEGSRCQRWLPVSVYVRVVACTRTTPVAFRICCCCHAMPCHCHRPRPRPWPWGGLARLASYPAWLLQGLH